jgi:hypothetical protein
MHYLGNTIGVDSRGLHDCNDVLLGLLAIWNVVEECGTRNHKSISGTFENGKFSRELTDTKTMMNVMPHTVASEAFCDKGKIHR